MEQRKGNTLMNMLIISHFCGTFSPTDNGRFKYIAEMLVNNNLIEIITSDFLHDAKKPRGHLPVDLPYKVTFLNEPGYLKNVSLKRFYSHFKWGLQVRKYLRSVDKPDIVYCAVPSLTGPYFAAKYCEKNNISFIIDVQDLWPEAFKMVFSIPLLSTMTFAPFKFLANGIYKRADEIVAVSDTYVQRALKVNKKCKKAHSVYLGTNLETFDGYATANHIEKRDDKLKIGYCGTLGSSYDLTCVVDALELINNQGMKAPQFIVLGDGPRKDEFERYAEHKGIDAIFYGRVPYDQMCGILSGCDIVVNPITKGAAQSIINKHADYAASGLPVVNTQECEEYKDLVDKYEMGYNCNTNDPRDLAKKIILLMENEQFRSKMGANARKCAEEKFDRKKTYINITDVILKQDADRGK